MTRVIRNNHISYVNRPPPWSWRPSFLFAHGERGAWYDPSDLTTLFQDAAGTIPVTGPDQPVGLMRDKSGNGNHAAQSAAMKTPVYTLDTDGRPCLVVDGSDDGMAAPSMSLPTTQYEWTGWAYSGSGGRFFCEHSATVNNYNGHYIYGQGGSSWAMRRAGVLHAGTGGVFDTGKNVLERQYIADVGGSIFRNGVLVPTSGAGGTGAIEQTVTAAYNLFCRNLGALFSSGRFYGQVLLGRTPSAAEIVAARAWLASKAGVSL